MENTHTQEVNVSIIIPLYNARSFIKETIESVISQTYQYWELIVVDDHSGDGSYEIVLDLAKHDNRIRVYRTDENSGGPAVPRNKGISLSRGKYIAFLDADDVWRKEKLEKQIEFLKQHNKTFTSCNYFPIDKNSKQLPKNMLTRWRFKRKKKERLSDVIKSNFIVTSSVMIESRYIEKFDTSKEVVAVEDLCMWLKIFYKYKFIYKYQDAVLVGYRILPNSISKSEGRHKQDLKINYCLYTFLLRYNLPQYLPMLNTSICKNRIGKIIGNVLQRIGL